LNTFKNSTTKQQGPIEIAAIGISAVICVLLLPTRFPGMEVLGIGPSWLVMWLVVWTLNRSFWSAVIAAAILGGIQDGMTIVDVGVGGVTLSHIVSLVGVAATIKFLQKRQFVKNNLGGAIVLVVTMTIWSEVISGIQHLLDFAHLQFPLGAGLDLGTIWQIQSRTVLIAAILGSIWMPVLYYPLKLAMRDRK
jgi:rod shape-determining protein MreD